MLTATTHTDGFIDVRCEGADGCGAKFDGIGPLWAADILAVHHHGPANGNDIQREISRRAHVEFKRRLREAADKARRAAAEAEFWSLRR